MHKAFSFYPVLGHSIYSILYWMTWRTLLCLRLDKISHVSFIIQYYPAYFSFMKPVLPTATERYEIRNPSFHTPAIKHKFAECSLQYCLINQLNSENCFALLTDKVNLNSFYSFKVFVKSRILNYYQH